MLGPVGKPQWIAGTLLLVFLAQCAWLVSRNLHTGQMDLREWYRLDAGLRLWHATPPVIGAPDPHSLIGPGPPPRIRDNDGFDPDHSALWYLISSSPLLVWPGRFQSASLPYWGWLARAPHLLFGLLLGASLWYVARRLYGNEGGFIALTLYCFSPGIIRAAAAAIWGSACAIAFLLLFAAYFFRPFAFWQGLRHATWLGIAPQAFIMPGAYHEFFAVLGQNSPALLLALPVALLTYVLWPRARYFGNTAPLLVAALCLLLGFAAPHYQGLGFQLVAVPFLFVFVSGICADLLETKQRTLVMAGILGVLLAYALWSFTELARAAVAH